jgi:hypothetical protein
MENTTCFPDKSRSASTAFDATAGDDVDSKEEEEEAVQSEPFAQFDSVIEETFVGTLTTPSIEECVCFLERNTTIRQFIGFLLIELEKEEQEVGDKANNSSAKEEVVGDNNNACDNDSVSTAGSDTGSSRSYDDDGSCVSWRDLAADDGDEFGLEDDSYYGKNDFNDMQWDDCHSTDQNACDGMEASSQQSDIPMLQELAFVKVSAQFQKDSKSSSTQEFACILAVADKIRSQESFRHHQKQLKASLELEAICVLKSLISTAKNKFDERAKWMQCFATSCRISIINAKKR